MWIRNKKKDRKVRNLNKILTKNMVMLISFVLGITAVIISVIEYRNIEKKALADIPAGHHHTEVHQFRRSGIYT